MPDSPFMLLPNATGRPGQPGDGVPPFSPDPFGVNALFGIEPEEQFQHKFRLLGNEMPHTGAPPAVDNQPPVNTQGSFPNPGLGPSQPFQMGSRNQGGIGGLLAGLLGRELPPSLPTNQQATVPELSGLSAEAARGGDPQRAKTLRGLLERRQDVGPQGPLSQETPLTTADSGKEEKGFFESIFDSFNPFAQPELQQDPNQ